MPALGEFVEVDEFWIFLLGPAPWSWIEFVGEDADGDRNGDTFDIEIPFAKVLPVKTGAGKRSVRQPRDRDVVENVIAREALVLSLEDACDQLVAARVVIQEVSRQ